MADNVRAHTIISGRVQGVWFRMETKKAADRIGVNGWVKNLPDGTVEALFEGPKVKVDDVLSWCWQGPPLAKVSNVVIDWETHTGEFAGFEVTY